MKLSFRRITLAAFASLSLAACSVDSPTAAAPRAAPAPPSAALVAGIARGQLGVKGVLRAVPLAEPMTVKATIGAEGGSLSIPEAGAMIVVPAGALSESTEITMTARAGRLLAYDFEPHGIVFARPLVLKQDLRGTTASLLDIGTMQLGYYDDASLLSDTGALVSQLMGGKASLFTWTFTAGLPHFSGYMIAN